MNESTRYVLGMSPVNIVSDSKMNMEKEGLWSKLPIEIIQHIFQFVSPNVLYGKFIKPYVYKQKLCPIQFAAYQITFQAKCIIRSQSGTREARDSLRMFYSDGNMTDSLMIYGFDQGYKILRHLFDLNMKDGFCIMPEEICLKFIFDDFKDGEMEIQHLIKLLEILSLDNYYKTIIPRIVIQIRYDLDLPSGTKFQINKVMRKMEILGRHIVKVFIQNKFTLKVPMNKLHLLNPSTFQNLKEVRLWNNGLTDSAAQSYISLLPNSLRILDLSANNITNLSLLRIPISLEELYISANSLVSIDGPNYQQSNLKLFDVSINAIHSVENIKFPTSLTQLRITYNSLSSINQDQIPKNLEFLALSENLIELIDEIELPTTIRELHLSSNKLNSFIPGFFHDAKNLSILDLSNNLVDDVDELGDLPDTLCELVLDNNEIDNSNLNNILSKKITKLSMISTGLISLNSTVFPNTIKEINLSKNEINEIYNVKFGLENLTILNLSGNKLKHFIPESCKIHLPSSVKVLDLSDNEFQDLSSFVIPPYVEILNLSGIELNKFDLPQSFINALPQTIKVLKLCDIFNTTHDTKFSLNLSIDFKVMKSLQELYLERNNIANIENVTYPMNLRKVSFAHNKITEIRFKNFPTNIEYLKLNGNKIKNVLSLPYFPRLTYFGVNGDQTELVKLGSSFAKERAMDQNNHN